MPQRTVCKTTKRVAIFPLFYSLFGRFIRLFLKTGWAMPTPMLVRECCNALAVYMGEACWIQLSGRESIAI